MEGKCMSYMDSNQIFAPANGIQELSFNEIDQVDGGLLPAILALAALAGACYLAYQAGRSQGNC
jgi:lactobin A/cerein 7B family class IIb bacteriocin